MGIARDNLAVVAAVLRYLLYKSTIHPGRHAAANKAWVNRTWDPICQTCFHLAFGSKYLFCGDFSCFELEEVRGQKSCGFIHPLLLLPNTPFFPPFLAENKPFGKSSENGRGSPFHCL